MALKLGELFYEFDADTSKLKSKQKEIVKTNKTIDKSFKKVGENIDKAFDEAAQRKVKALADKTKALADKTKALDSRTKALTTKTEVLADKNKILADKNKLLADKNKILITKTEVLSDKTKVLTDKNKLLSDKARVLADKTKILTDKTKLLSDKTKILADKNKLLAIRSKEAAKAQAILKRRQEEIARTNDKVSKSFSRLGKFIAAAFSLELLRRALMMADNMVRLKGRIDNLTKSQKESNKLFRDLVSLANELGVGIDGVLTSFQRFSLVKDIIGANNAQILQFTENIQKLGIVSGATGQEITSTSIQIGQAITNNFSSAAQEINSINEQMPEVARAVERSLGLIPGTFKKAVTEGRVTATQFFNAILKESDNIDKKFANLPVTMERAINEFSNNLAVALSDVDEIAEVTQTIAKFIREAADTLGGDFRADTIFIVSTYHDWLATSKNLVATLASGFKQVRLELGLKLLWLDKSIAKQKEEIELVKENLRLTISANNAIASASKARLNAKKQESTKIAIGFVGPQEPVGLATGGTSPEITKVTSADKIRAAMGDETQVILNALQERNNKIIELQKISDEERKKLSLESQRIANRELIDLEAKQNQVRITSMQAANDGILGVLKNAGKERTAVGKIALAADIVLALQSAAVSLGQNMAMASKVGGFPANIPFIAGAVAQGASIISTIQNARKGAGRQHGGPVSAGMMHPINEDGGPEIFQQGARQFLLPGGKGGTVTPMGGAANDGVPNITINNTMAGASVSVASVSRDEIVFMVKQSEDNAVSRVDASLARGQGSTARGLKQGFKTERNIR